MESMERLENLPELSNERPGIVGRFWNAFKSFPKKVGSVVLASYRAILFAIAWSWREFWFWMNLFLYTSRRFLRVEVYLALLGAFLFFGWVMTNNRADNMRDLLEHCYMYFTVVMVLLCMNLLPRERDEGTLEILWSQPMRRGPMILMQLLTVTAWILLLGVFVVLFFSYFSVYPEGRGTMLLFLLTTSFAVGAITVLISTFCLHGIATGLVTLLVLGVHYYWLRPLGPIDLFLNPILPPGFQGRSPGMGGFIFNRVITIVLAGFVLDYLLRRLRQTARWFT